ncbi:hypothetical protein H4W33_004240 [Kibdelosporangium phytohabitans]|uniref:Uncharacterized protein n=1 Tax=Kibdelosporangium phytohabitans TaxID=860235 RepID=A0A0N9I0V3_9PSEU|nr:hypothetical protein AOZ06_47040 [Kibdelosporangium phytohabitans]MBE1465228.1 hypothetical protein [Kibdelosporangium phytohabitans]
MWFTDKRFDEAVVGAWPQDFIETVVRPWQPPSVIGPVVKVLLRAWAFLVLGGWEGCLYPSAPPRTWG